MFRKFRSFTRPALFVAAALALGATTTVASNVGVDLNVHIGNQPQQVVVPPPVVVAPAVPPPAPFIVVEQDVSFVYPSQLGFYVAVGVPYDLFYVKNKFYLCRDGHWYRAPGSHGPWTVTQYRDLPPRLRKYPMERVRAYRNAEYDVYRRDRNDYRGRHFMTRKDDWKEHRREEHELRKEMKHEEHEHRKEMKREEKEERKAEKEWSKHHGGGKNDRD